MSREEKKQYLKSYRHLKRLWKIERERLDNFRLVHTGPKAIQYSDMPKGSLNIRDLSDVEVLREELEEKTRKREADYLARLLEIKEAIHSMQNLNDIEILDRWYIKCEPREKIMSDMGYEQAQIYRLRNEALDRFEIPAKK